MAGYFFSAAGKKGKRMGFPHFEVKADERAEFDLDDVKDGWKSLKDEYSYEIKEIEGSIPEGLRGTLYRNGPGMMDVFGQQIANPIDGDGMICAVGFAGGRAFFRNRYVRTAGFVDEQAAKRVMHRGVFGTKRSSAVAPSWMLHVLDMKFKNTANTCVVYYEGKLLALWEGGLPHALNPATLDTLGEEDFGVLDKKRPFAAHTRIDPVTGHFVGICPFAMGPKTELTVYEWTEKWQLVSERTWQLPDYAYFHDFAITPHYYVFFQNSESQGKEKILYVLSWLMGFGSPGEDWHFDPSAPARVWLMPRPSLGEDVSGVVPPSAQGFELEPSVAWHLNNAFEGEEEEEGGAGTSRSVFLDCIRHPHTSFSWTIEQANSIGGCAQFTRIKVVADGEQAANGAIIANGTNSLGSAQNGHHETNGGISNSGTELKKVAPVTKAHMGKAAVVKKVEKVMTVEKRSAELAVLHPDYTGRKYRYAYMVAAKELDHNAPFQCIVKYDMGEQPESSPSLAWKWFAGTRCFVGEPIFTPAAAAGGGGGAEEEDEGWVLTLVFDAERSKTDVVVLDAKRGTLLCRLRLTHHVPYGFHGSFCPEVVPPELS